ncbi:MAG: hypothetical protein JNL11_04390 [Bdellovibrionaceae bacterium]|nr:hypothetical protein [Pseudobdellovibrionaceae bacterium]
MTKYIFYVFVLLTLNQLPAAARSAITAEDLQKKMKSEALLGITEIITSLKDAQKKVQRDPRVKKSDILKLKQMENSLIEQREYVKNL